MTMVYWIIAGIILLTVIIYWRFSRHEIQNENKGIILDNEGCYRINDHSLQKCSAKKALKTFKCELLGGKFLNGELVLHTRNELIWLDRRTLQGLEYKELPFIRGHIAWIDYANGNWWICDVVSGEPKKTRLFAFDDKWQISGFWRLPITDEITGGCFGEQVLYLSTDAELYTVNLPPDAVFAEIVGVSEKPVKGSNFSIEKDAEKLYIWGLKGSKIIRAEI